MFDVVRLKSRSEAAMATIIGPLLLLLLLLCSTVCCMIGMSVRIIRKRNLICRRALRRTNALSIFGGDVLQGYLLLALQPNHHRFSRTPNKVAHQTKNPSNESRLRIATRGDAYQLKKNTLRPRTVRVQGFISSVH